MYIAAPTFIGHDTSMRTIYHRHRHHLKIGFREFKRYMSCTQLVNAAKRKFPPSRMPLDYLLTQSPRPSIHAIFHFHHDLMHIFLLYFAS